MKCDHGKSFSGESPCQLCIDRGARVTKKIDEYMESEGVPENKRFDMLLGFLAGSAAAMKMPVSVLKEALETYYSIVEEQLKKDG